MSAEKGLSFEFEERTVDIRGTSFKLRELTAEAYDECVKSATGPDDEIDMVILLRLMLLQSVIDPKLDPEAIGKMPYSVTRQLTTAVNRLHFSDQAASAGNA